MGVVTQRAAFSSVALSLWIVYEHFLCALLLWLIKMRFEINCRSMLSRGHHDFRYEKRASKPQLMAIIHDQIRPSPDRRRCNRFNCVCFCCQFTSVGLNGNIFSQVKWEQMKNVNKIRHSIRVDSLRQPTATMENAKLFVEVHSQQTDVQVVHFKERTRKRTQRNSWVLHGLLVDIDKPTNPCGSAKFYVWRESRCKIWNEPQPLTQSSIGASSERTVNCRVYLPQWIFNNKLTIRRRTIEDDYD